MRIYVWFAGYIRGKCNSYAIWFRKRDFADCGQSDCILDCIFFMVLFFLSDLLQQISCCSAGLYSAFLGLCSI